jgi:hypothetical protein
MKHLIYIYCYHIDLLDEFIENCYPLVEKFNWVDLHIDFCKDTIDDGTLTKLENKKITYGLVENKGLDVLPFIRFLYENVLNKNIYNVITKIHSKKSNQALRKLMYIPLIQNFEKNHLIVKTNDNKITILNNNLLLDRCDNKQKKLNEHQIKWNLEAFEKVKILNKILNLKNEYGDFFYGTMFMTSIYFLEKLFNVDYNLLEPLFKSGKPNNGYEFTFEKIFGYSITEFGGEHITFECENIYLKLNTTFI